MISRKFVLSILTLSSVVGGSVADLPWWAIAAQAAVGIAYVVAQALVDARGGPDPAVALEALDAMVRALREQPVAGEETPPTGDTAGILDGRAAAVINPAIVLALIDLARTLIGIFGRRRR